MRPAERETRLADLFIVIGSSLVVYPAAGLLELAKRNGSQPMIVNRDATGLEDMADLVANRSIAEAMGTVIDVN